MNAAVTVARLATAAYLRQLHAEGAEPEILMNRAVSHADWMTTSSAKAGDLQLADAYAGVTAWLSASRERMYTRRGPAVLAPLTPAPDHGPLAATLSDRTLAKVLSRPAYVPPGTEPEPFSVEGMHIVSGWLVEPVGEHTCGAGPNGHYGAHEPGCGYEPVARLDDLPGWPGEHASSDIPSIVELDRQQALDSLIANAVAWANGPFGHKALDGALRLAVADYERAVQS